MEKTIEDYRRSQLPDSKMTPEEKAKAREAYKEFLDRAEQNPATAKQAAAMKKAAKDVLYTEKNDQAAEKRNRAATQKAVAQTAQQDKKNEGKVEEKKSEAEKNATKAAGLLDDDPAPATKPAGTKGEAPKPEATKPKVAATNGRAAGPV